MSSEPDYFFKYAVVGLAFFSLFFALLYFIIVPFPFFNSDLTNFLTGAQILRSSSRAELYNSAAQSHFQSRLLAPYHFHPAYLLPFRYPPLVALLYLPLTLVPFIYAYFLNWLFLLSVLFLGLYLFYKHFSFPFLWLVPFAFTPFVYSLLLGQPSVIIALSPVLIYHFFSRKLFFTSGFSALLLLIKPQYFLVALPFLCLASPGKKFLLGLVSGLITILVTGYLLVGPGFLFEYPRFIFSTESSRFGTLSALLINLPLPAIILLLPLVLGLVIKIKPSLPSVLLCLPFFLCAFSGHSFSQDLTLLLFPLFILLHSHPGLGLFLTLIFSLGFPFIPHITGWLILFTGLYLLLNPPKSPGFGKIAWQ